MVESWVCPNCEDQYLIDGRAYVMHRKEGPLDPNVLKFDIVVRECYCPCGAVYNRGVWRKKVILTPATKTNVGEWEHRTLIAGEWMVTEQDAIKAKHEISQAQILMDENLKRQKMECPLPKPKSKAGRKKVVRR